MTEPTQGDALAAIAEEDANALKLVGDLMERNARDTAWALEQAYESELAAHERTKQRLEAALDRLDTIERRIDWLFGRD